MNNFLDFDRDAFAHAAAVQLRQFPAVRPLGRAFVGRSPACAHFLQRATLGAVLLFGARLPSWALPSVWRVTRNARNDFAAICADVARSAVPSPSSSPWSRLCGLTTWHKNSGASRVLVALAGVGAGVVAALASYSADDSRVQFSPKYRRARRRFVAACGVRWAHKIVHASADIIDGASLVACEG